MNEIDAGIPLIVKGSRWGNTLCWAVKQSQKEGEAQDLISNVENDLKQLAFKPLRDVYYVQ